ncbi:MAG: immunoglobulin domain-containing protein [Opitutaceae bacterium]|nr:immunoglobulin domain-containing protein [Opitutaceae bacterium]
MARSPAVADGLPTRWVMLHVQGQIGQADCHLITLPDGRHVLVDAGEGVDARGAVLSQLQRHGVTHVALVVLSHFHFDHYGHLVELIDAGVQVDRVVMNPPGDRRIADREMPWGCDYDHVMATIAALRERGVRCDIPRAGDRLIETRGPDGTMTAIDVICAHDGITTPVGETDINDTSIVMRLVHGTTRVLFTGDLNHTLGAYLARSGADLGADILKAAHHGTEGCPPNEFYDQVAPGAVLVPSPTGLWLSQRSSRTRTYFADRGTPALVSGMHGNVSVWLSSGAYRIESEIRDFRTEVTLAPQFVIQPTSAQVGAGIHLTLSATATGNPAPTLQWYKDGQAIPGAIDATYTMPAVSVADTAVYQVVASNRHGAAISVTANVSVSDLSIAPTPATLVNLSARARTAPGDAALIAGFVIGGSGSKELLLRAVGPSLAARGVGDCAPNPRLVLTTVDGRPIAHAINWSVAPRRTAIAAAAVRVGAFALPDDSHDAALLVSLPAGAYTALADDRYGEAGVVLIELYDLNPASSASLVNLSARARVTQGEGALIAGFVTAGQVGTRVLCRGIGANLARFGVSGYLARPMVTLHDAGSITTLPPVRSTTDATDGAELTLASRLSGAFSLGGDSEDVAALLTLAPGVRTAVLGSADASDGIALLELYQVP